MSLRIELVLLASQPDANIMALCLRYSVDSNTALWEKGRLGSLLYTLVGLTSATLPTTGGYAGKGDY